MTKQDSPNSSAMSQLSVRDVETDCPVVTASTQSEQISLFPELANPAAQQDQLGFRAPVAASATGITYRQLDYWARTGLVEPSIRTASGSGSQRLYSFRDMLVLKIVKRLLDTGVSLTNIRSAVDHLRERGVQDLSQLTLMSDGNSVYECRSADEVVDLVAGGQGVFGIAVGRVWREVEGSLAHLSPESLSATKPGEATAVAAPDELSARRAKKIS